MTNLQQTHAIDRCHDEHHHWRPFVGDPIEPRRMDGWRCFCGAKRLVWHTCACGHGHLLTEPA